MSWVRIHDGAMTHPKLIGLSDKAFRLWIWGLSYSQQHLTDGWIPVEAVQPRLKRADEELLAKRLWERDDPAGYWVHDYLDWNDSKEIVLAKRDGLRQRVGKSRGNALQRSSYIPVSTSGVGKSSSLEEKESELFERAARFLDRYDEMYSQKRQGAKHFRRQPALDHTRAIDLCRTWDDERLDKLAVIFLTTDDDWISRTDRSLAVFASRATWCDERLAAWESQQKRSAS